MKRILIVDDDEINRMMLSNCLEKFAPCDVCGNGQEGLELFEKSCQSRWPYDLVCIDLVMPVMNGHMLLRKIREMEAEYGVVARVKIFIISASSSPWDMADTVLDNIADDYIVKPFSNAKLKGMLEKYSLI